MIGSANTVHLVGSYGGDETHALSAWTSTDRTLTEEKHERIGKLLSFLASNGHHTPFEKSMLHFVVTCDTATHIHLLKHRIGVSINAESPRYKELRGDSAYIPRDWPEELQLSMAKWCDATYATYHKTLEDLVVGGKSRQRAKESARFYLPYANQLQLDVSFNFRSFMHFQGLRNTEHAQLEIREISQTMLDLVFDLHVFDRSLAAFGYEDRRRDKS